MDASTQSTATLLNGVQAALDSVSIRHTSSDHDSHAAKADHSAKFFDPSNSEAFKLREEMAIDTLDELLDYLLCGGGSVGILDATNSTVERRQHVFDHIKAREPKLGILFIESVCKNPEVRIMQLCLISVVKY